MSFDAQAMQLPQPLSTDDQDKLKYIFLSCIPQVLRDRHYSNMSTMDYLAIK